MLTQSCFLSLAERIHYGLGHGVELSLGRFPRDVSPEWTSVGGVGESV